MKEFFVFVLFCAGWCYLYGVVSLTLGIIFSKTRFKRLGFHLKALSGLQFDLVSDCPYSCSCCDHCEYWSCPNYRKEHKLK